MMADEVRVGENLARLVGVWERRKWLAILGFAAAFATSATVTFVLPNVYQSAATVMVVRQQFRDGPDPRLPTRRQKIPIRSRLDQLIHQFDLYPTERTKLSADALVEQMRRDIEVKPKFDGTGNIFVFTVKYQGPDSTTVALVANALAGYFVDENTEFRIVDPAVPATTPSAPNRPRLLLMSLALSTGLAIGLVLLAEQFDTSVHTVAVIMIWLVLLGLLMTLALTTQGSSRPHPVTGRGLWVDGREGSQLLGAAPERLFTVRRCRKQTVGMMSLVSTQPALPGAQCP